MTPEENLQVAALLREFVEWLECPWDHTATLKVMRELADWLESSNQPFPWRKVPL